MGAEETKELKAWISRILSGSIGLIIMLTISIWGITWWSLREQVADHEIRIQSIERKVEVICTRNEGMEKSIDEIKMDVKDVKTLLQKRR